ncbi:MAG: hypothetical protein H0Z24_08310 [Thermosipho sp. (in: Bacteria)]|nr:hypothetical protein [Thermosipho sp. (in: thermotogales)]
MKKTSYFLVIIIIFFVLSSCGETNIPPSIPSNPVPANGATSVILNPILTWYTFDEENDEILSYLYFGKSSSPVLVEKDLEVFKYELIELEPGTTYYWKVVVKDSNGGIAESPIWKFTTTHIPNEPKLVFPENNSILNEYKIRLKWKATDLDNDKLKFDIYFGTKITDLKLLAKEYENTEYELPNLNESMTYYWKVIVKDGKGGVKEGPIWSFTTNSVPKIKKLIFPENNQIKVSLRTKLKWEGFDKDNDNLIYFVYLGENFSNLNLVGRTKNEELEVKLKSDTKYYWKVIVEDEKGAVSESEIFSFTTCFKPSAPVNTGIKDGEQNLPLNVSLSWECRDEDSEIIYYDLYFGEKDNLELIVENYKKTTYFLDNLEPGTTYYWKIIAKDEMGLRAESPVWSFTTSYLPLKPVILNPKNGLTGVLAKKILLEWKSSDLDNDTIYYDLYLGNSPNLLTMVLNESTSTKYEIQNLKPGCVYYWKVVAYDKKSGEISSDIYSFKTNSLPKFDEQFYPKNGEKNVSTSVSIRWNARDDDNDVLYFDIYYGLEPNKMELIVEDYLEDSFTLTNLKVGSKYYWKVIAKDNKSGTVESQVFSFETTNSPILKDIYPKNGVKISLNDSLKWEFYDPDGDPLMYDIYIGYGDKLELIEENYQANTYKPSLKPGMRYYWKIIAKDRKGGIAKTLINEFETNSLPILVEPIYPINGQVNVLVNNVNLSWNAFDPENDELVYDVYFGEANKMNLIASKLKVPSYNIGYLEPGKVYYWKVVVKDRNSGSLESSIWKFKTENILFFEDFENYPLGLPPTKNTKWEGEYKSIGNGNIVVSCEKENKFLRIKAIEEDDFVNLSRSINLSNGYIEFDFMIDNKESSFYVGTFEKLSKDSKYEGVGPLIEVLSFNNESYLCVYNSEKNILEKVYKIQINKWYKIKIDFSLQKSKKYHVYINDKEVGVGIVKVDYLNYFVISSALSYVSNFSYIDNIKIVKKDDKMLSNPPCKPINIFPTDKALISSTTVTLKWYSEDLDKDKIYFDIYFGEGENLKLVRVNLRDTNFTLTNLKPGKTYYWKVVAKNVLGGISESNTFSFKIVERIKENRIVDENFENYPLGIVVQIPWIKFRYPRKEILEITNDEIMGKVLKVNIEKDDNVVFFISAFNEISEIEEISEGYIEFDAKFEPGNNLIDIILVKKLGNGDFARGPGLVFDIFEDSLNVYKDDCLEENFLTSLEFNKWHHFKIYFKDYNYHFYINEKLYGSYKMDVKNFSAFLISLSNIINKNSKSFYLDNFKIVKIESYENNKLFEPQQDYRNLIFEDTFDEYENLDDFEKNWLIVSSDKNSYIELVKIDGDNQVLKLTDSSTGSCFTMLKTFSQNFNNLVLEFNLLITGKTFFSLMLDGSDYKVKGGELPQLPNVIIYADEKKAELCTMDCVTEKVSKLKELNYDKWYNIKIKIYKENFEIFIDNNSLGKYPLDSSIVFDHCIFFTAEEYFVDYMLIDNFKVYWEN